MGHTTQRLPCFLLVSILRDAPGCRGTRSSNNSTHKRVNMIVVVLLVIPALLQPLIVGRSRVVGSYGGALGCDRW